MALISWPMFSLSSASSSFSQRVFCQPSHQYHHISTSSLHTATNLRITILLELDAACTCLLPQLPGIDRFRSYLFLVFSDGLLHFLLPFVHMHHIYDGLILVTVIVVVVKIFRDGWLIRSYGSWGLRDLPNVPQYPMALDIGQ